MNTAAVTDEQTYTSLREANVARQKAWDTNDAITIAYRGNELAGEVGEACNVIKKLERERLGIRGSRDTVEHLAEELADVVICADLIAMGEGIDLDAAVAAKFNATSEKVGLPQRLAAAAIPAEPVTAGLLSNLLARIHRDGGHYEVQHGTEQAVFDADLLIARIYAEYEGTLAAPTAAEPVAWRVLVNDNGKIMYIYTERLPYKPPDDIKVRSEPVPLYAAPRPAEPVADGLRDAIDKLADVYCEGHCRDDGGRGKFSDCTGCEIAALADTGGAK